MQSSLKSKAADKPADRHFKKLAAAPEAAVDPAGPSLVTDEHLLQGRDRGVDGEGSTGNHHLNTPEIGYPLLTFRKGRIGSWGGFAKALMSPTPSACTYGPRL